MTCNPAGGTSKRQRQPTVTSSIRGQIVARSPRAAHLSAIPSPSAVSTRSAEKESVPGIVSYGALEVNRGTAVGIGLGVGDGVGEQVELGQGIGVTVAVSSGESLMGGGEVAANVGVEAAVSAVDVMTAVVPVGVAGLIAVAALVDAAALMDAVVLVGAPVGATSVGETMPTPYEPQAAKRSIINDSRP